MEQKSRANHIVQLTVWLPIHMIEEGFPIERALTSMAHLIVTKAQSLVTITSESSLYT